MAPSTSMSQIRTAAPASASRSAMARPRPLAPPVTTAPRPWRLISSARPRWLGSGMGIGFRAGSLWLLAQRHRQSLPAPDDGGVQLGVLAVHLPVRKASQHLVEGYSGLHPGQGGAETEVDPVAEGQVVSRPAVDVEHVAVGWEGPVVAVGRAPQQHDGAAGRNGLAVQLHV